MDARDEKEEVYSVGCVVGRRNEWLSVGWLAWTGRDEHTNAYSANDDEETLTTPAGRQGVAVQC